MYDRGKLYLGMLLAPFASALRYALGRYNADLKNRGHLIPWFTLAANILACTGGAPARARYLPWGPNSCPGGPIPALGAQ